MIKVTIEQTKKYDTFDSTQECVGVFDDPIKTMPFLSEFMEHFQYKRIIIEPIETEELEDTEQ